MRMPFRHLPHGLPWANRPKFPWLACAALDGLASRLDTPIADGSHLSAIKAGLSGMFRCCGCCFFCLPRSIAPAEAFFRGGTFSEKQRIRTPTMLCRHDSAPDTMRVFVQAFPPIRKHCPSQESNLSSLQHFCFSTSPESGRYGGGFDFLSCRLETCSNYNKFKDISVAIRDSAMLFLAGWEKPHSSIRGNAPKILAMLHVLGFLGHLLLAGFWPARP